jgi:FKBP-type peptidyl-prolyl cis-trans isomerase
MKTITGLLALIVLSGCQKQPSTTHKRVQKKKTTEVKKMIEPKRTIPKGLHTEVIHTSANPDAKMPEVGNTVLVHYTGYLALDDGTKGKIIDSSINRNQPLEFVIGLNQVIKGFEEGIMLMKEGEKRALTIAPELGYGENGVLFLIPPHATLIFEVELLKVI